MSKTISKTVTPTVVEIPALNGFTITDAKREWTREEIQERLDRITGAVEAIGKASQPVMFEQALALVNLQDVTRVVGKGDQCIYPTAEAAQIALGIRSKSYGTRLLRLGRALVRHGVRKNSADYAFLSDHGDAGFFSEVLGKQEPVSDDKFREVMKSAREVYAKNGGKGSFPSAAKVAQITSGTEATREPGGTADQTQRNDDRAEVKVPTGPVTLGDWRSLVGGLESDLKRVTDEDAPKVHAMLLRLVSGDVNRRKVLASKEKANGATPRPPKGRKGKPSPVTTEAKGEATPEPQPEPTKV